MTFPKNFDPIYFADSPWSERVQAWERQNISHGFSAGNATLIRRLLDDDATGLRVVINITPAALEAMLREDNYRNIYEHPDIGGQSRAPSKDRKEVDEKLSIGPDTYFGAVALGGAGLRFYGTYCMVLSAKFVDSDTQLFDRDSYEILLPPLADAHVTPKDISRLKGKWQIDRVDMAMLKVLPEVRHDSRLVTSGAVSSMVLRDQEYIEVHLHQKFRPADLEEIRESADDAATEVDILERRRAGLHVRAEEAEWVRRRSHIAQLMDEKDIHHRVVTMYGRGYRWV